MTVAISCGLATLLSGVRASTFAILLSSLSKFSVRGVSVNQGETAFTLIPSDAHSTARLRVSCKSPALDIPYGDPV